MVHYLSFVFLFGFISLYFPATNYHHVNEVFNGYSHAYVADTVYFDFDYEEPSFSRDRIIDSIDTYFNKNIKSYLVHNHVVIFYYNDQLSNGSDLCNKFTIRLLVSLTFNVNYDKTFRYYIW